MSTDKVDIMKFINKNWVQNRYNKSLLNLKIQIHLKSYQNITIEVLYILATILTSRQQISQLQYIYTQSGVKLRFLLSQSSRIQVNLLTSFGSSHNREVVESTLSKGIFILEIKPHYNREEWICGVFMQSCSPNLIDYFCLLYCS